MRCLKRTFSATSRDTDSTLRAQQHRLAQTCLFIDKTSTHGSRHCCTAGPIMPQGSFLLAPVVPTVHVVAHEHVVRVWAVASDAEELQQIGKLACGPRTGEAQEQQRFRIAFLQCKKQNPNIPGPGDAVAAAPTVDVPADCDRRAHWLNIGLFRKNLLSLFT